MTKKEELGRGNLKEVSYAHMYIRIYAHTYVLYVHMYLLIYVYSYAHVYVSIYILRLLI
jgi:hypothetical protein